MVGFGVGAFAQADDHSPAKNIVIVHGAFADGSGWESVYRILRKHGYNVTIVQNPLATLAADVSATQNVLAKQDGPVVLVGHSYGGVVITEAGNDPNVKSLVYVAAFVPDEGESLASLSDTIKSKVPESTAVDPPIKKPENGFLLIDRAGFPAAFAGDINRKKAEFMAASQAPLGVPAYTGTITAAAWKTKPSYYIVSSKDQMISPAAEEWMAKRAGSIDTQHVRASHAVFISQPFKVAKEIEKAATR